MAKIEHLEGAATIAPITPASTLLRGWWRLVDIRIGIIPLPLFPLILVLMAGFVWLGKLPPDLTMMIPLIALCAYPGFLKRGHFWAGERVGRRLILAIGRGYARVFERGR